jgi:hypothetical protein
MGRLVVENDVAKVLEKLPEICAARLPSDQSPILLHRGVPGYTPWKPSFDVDGYNSRKGITPAQVEAMLVGSMFGWHVPGADPDNYAEDGGKKG